MKTSNKWEPISAFWQTAWSRRTLREQQALRLILGMAILMILWFFALRPALQIWQTAAVRQAQLDAQSLHIQQLRAQANSFRKPKEITRAEAIQWLEESLTELGEEAKISLQDERVTVNLSAASSLALADWLRHARENAQVLPVQAQLDQVNESDATKVVWKGIITLRLP